MDSGIFRAATLPELEALCTRLSAGIRPPLSIGLNGELGAGKTTFCRYLLRALGVREPVSSPTFNLAHEYTLPGSWRVEHWDLYRLTSLPDELYEPPEAQVIRLIEWSNKFAQLAGELDVSIDIAAVPDPQVELGRIYTISGRQA